MNWDYKYFKPEELLSPDGLVLLQRGVLPISEDAIIKLEAIREFYDTPFYVNHGFLHLRGFRSPREAFKLYGTHKFTFHSWCAFDVTQDKMPIDEFYESLKYNHKLFGIGGLGYYPHSNFVHIDFRAGDLVKWQK